MTKMYDNATTIANVHFHKITDILYAYAEQIKKKENKRKKKRGKKPESL